ncbi:MAG: IS21 family transposase [Candidatus Aegiribacteria sp.]|nr:IS21 family transposase [Candidatus Aegiribacteria sp.]
MRQHHRAGVNTDVDYAGSTLPLTDPSTGKVTQAPVFVGAVGVAGYLYAEATLTMKISDWISSHIRMFEFYGGATEIITPDNLKTGVKKSCRYDPDIMRTYENMVRYYGAVVIPARVEKPRDKALAENSVQNVQRWVVAPLRKRTFFSLAELNEAIREKLELLNNRCFSVREGSRQSQFEEVDLPELRSLPPGRFEYADWCKAKVHPDYHIQYHYCYYSVHHSYISKTVDVRATASGIEVFYKGKRIASHMRLRGRGKRSTVDEHMPAHHLAYKKLPANARKWLETRSGNTLLLARKIYSREKHVACSLRHLSGVMSLERKYGIEKLEEASGYILRHETSYRYRTLANALKYGLYKELKLFQQDTDEQVIEHANIRGADYYKGGN